MLWGAINKDNNTHAEPSALWHEQSKMQIKPTYDCACEVKCVFLRSDFHQAITILTSNMPAGMHWVVIKHSVWLALTVWLRQWAPEGQCKTNREGLVDKLWKEHKYECMLCATCKGDNWEEKSLLCTECFFHFKLINSVNLHEIQRSSI